MRVESEKLESLVNTLSQLKLGVQIFEGDFDAHLFERLRNTQSLMDIVAETTELIDEKFPGQPAFQNYSSKDVFEDAFAHADAKLASIKENAAYFGIEVNVEKEVCGPNQDVVGLRIHMQIEKPDVLDKVIRDLDAAELNEDLFWLANRFFVEMQTSQGIEHIHEDGVLDFAAEHIDIFEKYNIFFERCPNLVCALSSSTDLEMVKAILNLIADFGKNLSPKFFALREGASTLEELGEVHGAFLGWEEKAKEYKDFPGFFSYWVLVRTWYINNLREYLNGHVEWEKSDAPYNESFYMEACRFARKIYESMTVKH